MISTRIKRIEIKGKEISQATCTVRWTNDPHVQSHCISKLVNISIYTVQLSYICDGKVCELSEQDLQIEIMINKKIDLSCDYYPSEIKIDGTKCKIIW